MLRYGQGIQTEPLAELPEIKNRTLRNISNLFQNMRRVFFVEKGCRFSSSYFPIRVKAVARKFRRCVIVFCASCVNAIQCDTCCNDIVRARSRILQFFPVFISFCFVQNYGGDFCMRNFSVSVV